jgi:methionyl-tRNA formyltransferase
MPQMVAKSNAARVVFMGSPDFSLPALNALHDAFNVVGVVTQPDKPAGRGRQLQAPPVKTLAEQLGIPVYQPQRVKSAEAIQPIADWMPDVIVVAAYGHILRDNLLGLPPHGCLNVHASLLPRWRGAAPINAAILHGDEETGVTIMQMDAGLDTGAMLTKAATPIGADETAGELFVRLAELGAELLVKTLPAYMNGDLDPEAQDDALATYAPMLTKADAELDFSTPAPKLARMVRAYNPWPGAWLAWHGQPLKVHRASVKAVKRGGVGRRMVEDGLPVLNTSHGLLLLDEVQPAGKARMSGAAFLNGARDWAE